MPAAPEDAQRHQFPVLWPLATRWADNDHYGHANNVAYYGFFDTAVNAFLMHTTGVDIRELPAIGVVAETGCRYFSEVGFPDQLHIGLRLEKLGNRSVVYELGVFRNDASTPSAIGRFVHVYVDQKSRKAVPIPEAIRVALQKLLPTAVTPAEPATSTVPGALS